MSTLFQISKMIVAGGLLIGATACAPVSTTIDSTVVPAPAEMVDPVYVAPSFSVSRVNVSVPETLVVSEENSIKPIADIVWHGEAAGDRYAQVKSMMSTAFGKATAGMRGTKRVVIDVEVTRFHAVTPKTRYNYGGEQEIEFVMTVRDANSGVVIQPARLIDATHKGLCCGPAKEADAEDPTYQRTRLVDYVAGVVVAELNKPYAQ